MGTFFHAMALFPDIQQRAKQEIDAVVGCEQLIAYKDRLLLPYVEALYREILRWRPVVPLSLSHASTSDDVYKGYYIPKGAQSSWNTWLIFESTSCISTGTEIVTNVWWVFSVPIMHSIDVSSTQLCCPGLLRTTLKSIPSRRLSIPAGSLIKMGT